MPRLDQNGIMTESLSDTKTRLLAAYDAQLRTDAETQSATSVTVLGPLRLATQLGNRGFVTYRDLGDADEDAIRSLVADALAHFAADPTITRIEWKTRGHDRAPGLLAALVENGFEPEEQESIMIGEAAALAVDVELPPGVTLRRVQDEADVRAAARMQDEVFGDPPSDRSGDVAMRRIELNPDHELWVAEADGRVVSAGAIDPVPGTDFAGIWGGATREEWRGHGIYRAMTAARARVALTKGKTLINSDSTEYSRPILERSGFLKVSTTTPYIWKRDRTPSD
jgi:hypothetical protein